MKSKPTMHFSNMIEMLQGDHIAGIRYIKSLNLGCNEMKYAVAGAACYYARMLRNDSARRDEFYKEALQVKWVRLHRSKLLLHVVMYLEDAPKKGNKYKLASARRVALQGVCDDSDIPDEDIADYIKQHHGFKGLIQPDDEVPFDEEEIDKETRQTPGPLRGVPAGQVQSSRTKTSWATTTMTSNKVTMTKMTTICARRPIASRPSRPSRCRDFHRGTLNSAFSAA